MEDNSWGNEVCSFVFVVVSLVSTVSVSFNYIVLLDFVGFFVK